MDCLSFLLILVIFKAAVHDGENGIIITPGDISALVDALNGIHQSSKEPKEHGRSKKRRKRSR